VGARMRQHIYGHDTLISETDFLTKIPHKFEQFRLHVKRVING